MASVWGELKRRNVVKVAVTHAVVGWLWRFETGRGACYAVIGLLGTMILLTPGQVKTQQAAFGEPILEEIVVTARRREENLQDLPLSITALTADAMAAEAGTRVNSNDRFWPKADIQAS